MKDKIIIGFVLLFAGLLVYVWLSPSGTQTAPDITLKTASGKSISIISTEKRPILINFWATTCTTCLKEMPHLIELYKELHPKGLEIVGVSMSYDPPSQVMEMVKRKNIPYPIVFDLEKKIMHAFGMQRPLTPTTILVDPQGNIALRALGMPDMAQLKEKILTMLNKH